MPRTGAKKAASPVKRAKSAPKKKADETEDTPLADTVAATTPDTSAPSTPTKKSPKKAAPKKAASPKKKAATKKAKAAASPKKKSAPKKKAAASPKKKATPKKKKTTSTSTKKRKTKPTYEKMVALAIIALDNKRKGSSLAAICKFIEANYPVPSLFRRYVRIALKNSDIFTKVSASYRLSKKGRGIYKKKTKRTRRKSATKKSTAAGKTKKSTSTKKKSTKKPAKKTSKKVSDKTKGPKKPAATKRKGKAPATETEASSAKRAKSDATLLKRTPTPADIKSAKGKTPEGNDRVAVWQYFDHGWGNYDLVSSDLVEKEYQNYLLNPGKTDVRSVHSGQWNYMVDFLNMVQTNIQHETHTQRKIRRVVLTSA